MVGVWNSQWKKKKKNLSSTSNICSNPLSLQGYILDLLIIFWSESHDLVKFGEAVGIIEGQSISKPSTLKYEDDKSSHHVYELPPHMQIPAVTLWMNQGLSEFIESYHPRRYAVYHMEKVCLSSHVPLLDWSLTHPLNEYILYIWMWTHVWSTWWQSWTTNFGPAGGRGTQLHKQGGDQTMWCNPDINRKCWLWLERTYIGFLTRRHNQCTVTDTHCI